MNYLAVCGCYRSGTTIVSEVFSKHSDMLFTSELFTFHSLPLASTRLNLVSSNPETTNINVGLYRTLVNSIGTRYPEFIKEAANTRLKDVNDLINVFSRYTYKTAKTFGDKLPEYVLDVPRLTRLNKRIKIIVCVRDCRDVILSQVKNYHSIKAAGGDVSAHFWTKPDIKSAIDYEHNWFYYVNSWQRIKRDTECSYYELNYSSLVNNIDSEVDKLSSYLDVDRDELLLLFKNNFKPYAHNAWKKEKNDMLNYIPENWKVLMRQYGFLE